MPTVMSGCLVQQEQRVNLHVSMEAFEANNAISKKHFGFVVEFPPALNVCTTQYYVGITITKKSHSSWDCVKNFSIDIMSGR